MFGIQFYPTPLSVAYKLLSKLNYKRVENVLEPSAGKGDFIDAFNSYRKNELKFYTIQKRSFSDRRHKPTYPAEVFHNREELLTGAKSLFGIDFKDEYEVEKYCKEWEEDDDYEMHFNSYVRDSLDEKRIPIHCVEVDNNLCAILKEKKYGVDNADFLTWCSFTRYNTIIMNPPFADGDRHLLKAISLLENGGQICCILNAETIKNPYTQTRALLSQKLSEYAAEIEFVDNAFSNAENKTDVEVALIYIDIPEKCIDENVMRNFIKGDVYEKEYAELQENQLYAGDAISLLLEQFQIEARYGLKIIDAFNSMKPYIPKYSGEHGSSMITLNVTGCPDESQIAYNNSNRYIRGLREKYWTAVFQSNEISRLLTDAARQRYQMKMHEFRDVDFTLSNIKQLQIDLSHNLDKSINEAIVDMYDNFTYKHSMDNTKNVHMFSGWKTNKGFKINETKIIYPLYLYRTYGRYADWDVWRLKGWLDEVEKVMTYLDCGQTDGEDYNDVINRHFNAKKYEGERISLKYFDIEVKKKGTIHLFWKYPELIKKMTILGCKAHNTLPNDYGAKTYSELNDEEKNIVDAFEGEKNYQQTVERADFYLNTSSMLMLSAKNT